MADIKQQVRKTLDSVKMPPLIGPLADLPDHVKQVVEAYGRACVREAIAAALRAAPEGFVLVPSDSVVPCGCGCHRHCCRHCGYELGGLAARQQGVK